VWHIKHIWTDHSLNCVGSNLIRSVPFIAPEETNAGIMEASPTPSIGAKRTASGHAVLAPVFGLATLALFIAQSMPQSAVCSYDQERVTIHNARLSKPFQDLAAVSKHWRAVALDAVSSLALRTLSVHAEQLRRRDVLELQRAFLVSLEILSLPRTGEIHREQWVTVLSCVP
jgi:hypothetical protein